MAKTIKIEAMQDTQAQYDKSSMNIYSHIKGMGYEMIHLCVDLS